MLGIRSINERQDLCQTASGESKYFRGFMHNLFNFSSFNIAINENNRVLPHIEVPNPSSSYCVDNFWDQSSLLPNPSREILRGDIVNSSIRSSPCFAADALVFPPHNPCIGGKTGG